MKTYSDLVNHIGVADRKPSLGQIRTSITDWGKRNRSVRQRVTLTLWLDSEDRNDRIVISAEVVLNTRKTGPEKGVDLNLEVHHYSDYDPVKRRLTKSHPERYFRIDGRSEADAVNAIYMAFREQISGLQRVTDYHVPGIEDYKAA